MRLPSFRAKDPVGDRARTLVGAAAGAADPGPVQAARIRARRRLMGALVLLATGVVGFPILFETQPRPLPVDTPMLVPEGAARAPAVPLPRPVPSLPADAGNEVPLQAAAAAAASPAASPAAASAPATSAPVAVAAPAARASAAAPLLAAARPATVKPEPAKPEAQKPEAQKPEAQKPDSRKPDAVTAANTVSEAAAPASGRFVVQVGAYNEVERLRAARQKLEKLGYKSYTQDVETPGGKRTRVRVGPFASRQEAEVVAGKVKGSGMQANILAL